MKRSVLFSILMISLGFAACKKAKPEVTSLGKISGFSLGAATLTLNSLSLSNTEGQCPQGVHLVEISFDETNWIDLKTIDSNATLTCDTNGQFHYSIDFNRTDLASYKSALNAGQSVTIYGRGTADTGVTEDSSMRLSMLNSATAGGQLYVGVGQHVGNSGNYKLSGRISYSKGAEGFVSGTYKLKGLIRSQ